MPRHELRPGSDATGPSLPIVGPLPHRPTRHAKPEQSPFPNPIAVRVGESKVTRLEPRKPHPVFVIAPRRRGIEWSLPIMAVLTSVILFGSLYLVFGHRESVNDCWTRVPDAHGVGTVKVADGPWC